jgi:hypothetical protein
MELKIVEEKGCDFFFYEHMNEIWSKVDYFFDFVLASLSQICFSLSQKIALPSL